MPIVWSLQLSDMQISLLRAFAHWEQTQSQVVAKIRKNPKAIASPLQLEPDGAEPPTLKFSHFITHYRPLARERMIEHTTLKYGPTLQWVYNVYTVTDKGLHILAVIDIEMSEMAERHQLGDGLPSGAGHRLRKAIDDGRKGR